MRAKSGMLTAKSRREFPPARRHLIKSTASFKFNNGRKKKHTKGINNLSVFSVGTKGAPYRGGVASRSIKAHVERRNVAQKSSLSVPIWPV